MPPPKERESRFGLKKYDVRQEDGFLGGGGGGDWWAPTTSSSIFPGRPIFSACLYCPEAFTQEEERGLFPLLLPLLLFSSSVVVVDSRMAGGERGREKVYAIS